MSPEEVEADIQKSIKRGWFLSVSGFIPDLLGVAMPLPLADRQLCLLVAGPVFRVGDRLDEMVAALRSKIDRRMADISPVAPRHISLTPFSCRLIASGADVIIATPGRMLGGSPRRNGLAISILASDILNIWKCVCGTGSVTTLPERSLPTYLIQCCCERGG